MAGNELATAYITLVPSLKGAQASITKQLKGVNTTSAGKTMGDKAATGFGSAFGSVRGIVSTIAASAAVTAAAAFAKSALDAFADYEQLVGGVETLFKESSGKLQQYAAEAYKTAGMSANEYMEMSTSFAASLIQSLGGGTAKAADYANQAITDMSDNANKMGTDITMIQNAYQGFAKQNYTMLDNLKLGYGGTKEEMERLLADAEKLSGIEYDISSYADIVDAIHVIQTEMGITGTTALEASNTISGSVASMKASWENWTAALGREDVDMGDMTAKLVDSVATAASNVLPRIGQIASSIGTVFADSISKMRSALPELFAYIERSFTSGMAGIASRLPQVVNDIVAFVPFLGQQIVELVPTVLPSVLQAGIALLQGLVQAVPTAVRGVVNALSSGMTTVTQVLPTLLPMILQAAIGLFQGLVQAVPQVLPTLVVGVMNAVYTVGALLSSFVPQLLDSAVTLFTTLVDSIPVVVPQLIDAALSAIKQVSTYLPSLIPMILGAAVRLFLGIAQAVPQILDSLLSAVGSLISQVPGHIASFVDTMAAAGRDLVAGIARGVTDAAGEVWDAIKNVCSGAVDRIKDFFGIASPSKLMREMFGFVGEGMVLGLNDKAASVVGAMQGIADGTMSAASFSATPSLATAGAGYGGTTINNYYSIGNIDYTGDEQVERAVMNLFDALERRANT